jgi:RimJ/RimL family protein N-acetyltransferase
MLAEPLADGAELRLLEPWLAEEFAAHVAAERTHLAPWIPWARDIVDAHDARRFLQRYTDGTAQDGRRLYGIWLDGQLSGGALFRVFEVDTGNCEVGVWLAEAAQGRGLVTRAARRLIGWAIDVRGMARVEWRVVPHNARSIAVARRLGFTREGVLRKAFPLDGVRRDIEVWSLLAEEWRAAQSAR